MTNSTVAFQVPSPEFDLEVVRRGMTDPEFRAAYQRVAAGIIAQLVGAPHPPKADGGNRRMTSDHLTEVASVYRDAWESGKNPSQTVTDHFNATYSTATRWIVEARKRGILGASDSTRGGELGATDE